MKPAPAQLLAAYGAQVWEPITRAQFYAPDGTPLPAVDVIEGDWDASSDRWPREEATFTVPVALTPRATAPPVSPYGGTVVLTMGARLPGVGELTFRVTELDVTETTIRRPDSTVEVRAVSHEARVNEDRRVDRNGTDAGLSSAVVAGLVRYTMGAAYPVTNLLTTDPVLEAGAYDLDGDVWPVVESIMDAAGGEAVFTLSGLVLRDVPDKASTPAQVFTTGERDAGTITAYASTRGWAYNAVRLRWVSPDAKTRALRYKWEATRTAAPAAGHVSVNTADPLNAAVLYVHRRPTSDQDVAEQFAGLTTGDRVTIVQEVTNGPDKRLRYVATGRATIGTNVITIPVGLVSAKGTEPADESDVEVSVTIAEHDRVGSWDDTSAVSGVASDYGRHVFRETYQVDRGTLPTQAQANAAAKAMGLRRLDGYRTVTMDVVPAPWVEPGDTIRVVMLGDTTETLLVTGVSVPLTQLDPMTVEARDPAYTAT